MDQSKFSDVENEIEPENFDMGVEDDIDTFWEDCYDDSEYDDDSEEFEDREMEDAHIDAMYEDRIAMEMDHY